MHRPGIMLALCLASVPCITRAQSVTLSTANASGDCTGTSFHQAADASGKFLAAEWAAASEFPVGVNRGRVRCSIRFNVTVQAGFKIVPGGGSGNANRIAVAQLAPLRLNGSTSGILAESATSIDNGTPSTASAIVSGGPATMAMLALDRPASAPSLQSACSTPAKNTFQLSTIVDVATASNYIIPWPPEPYAERETASMGSVRLFYTVVPCGRSAIPQD
jgi:hypothetical protein